MKKGQTVSLGRLKIGCDLWDKYPVDVGNNTVPVRNFLLYTFGSGWTQIRERLLFRMPVVVVVVREDSFSRFTTTTTTTTNPLARSSRPPKLSDGPRPMDGKGKKGPKEREGRKEKHSDKSLINRLHLRTKEKEKEEDGVIVLSAPTNQPTKQEKIDLTSSRLRPWKLSRYLCIRWTRQRLWTGLGTARQNLHHRLPAGRVCAMVCTIRANEKERERERE